MGLRQTIIEDLKEMESELNYPTFIWKGNSYNFIPSISEFTRELETGGFKIVKLLTATVRKFDMDDEEYISVFTNNVYPTAQNIITYSLDATNYRIESIKHDSTNSYFRIIAHSTTKGI